ncbi:KTSC domain-containing protein [Sphingosinicella humi]|nr:KTSC domain-containing protein [Sphingosinicella humi]
MPIEDMPPEVEFPDSTAVARAAYRPGDCVLDLWWRQDDGDRTGRRYRYFDVPKAKYCELLAVHRAGGSVGEFCNREIKSHFDYAPAEED